MGSSEDPNLVNNVDELGLVFWGVRRGVVQAAHTRNNPYLKCTEVYRA